MLNDAVSACQEESAAARLNLSAASPITMSSYWRFWWRIFGPAGPEHNDDREDRSPGYRKIAIHSAANQVLIMPAFVLTSMPTMLARHHVCGSE